MLRRTGPDRTIYTHGIFRGETFVRAVKDAADARVRALYVKHGRVAPVRWTPDPTAPAGGRYVETN